MENITLAKTLYKEGYWLKWGTGFNSPTLTEMPGRDGKSVKSDIQVTLLDDKDEYLGDAICHWGSYGVENGLWEIMIDVLPKNHGDSVMGHLTFKEVIKFFDKKIKTLEKNKS